MSHLELCVETESCPMMILPGGQIVVPASCPGPLLVQYIGDHMEEAAKRGGASAKAGVLENHLTIKCINELGLIQVVTLFIYFKKAIFLRFIVSKYNLV